MVLADLHSNTLFFDPIFGGDPIFLAQRFLETTFVKRILRSNLVPTKGKRKKALPRIEREQDYQLFGRAR